MPKATRRNRGRRRTLSADATRTRRGREKQKFARTLGRDRVSIDFSRRLRSVRLPCGRHGGGTRRPPVNSPRGRAADSKEISLFLMVAAGFFFFFGVCNTAAT